MHSDLIMMIMEMYARTRLEMVQVQPLTMIKQEKYLI
ncbi:hypothetical protein FORC13_p228 (plasmid) [Bacillus cereus]|nr:hypothetical protein FORC13_p228 [Bacillus cereus]